VKFAVILGIAAALACADAGAQAFPARPVRLVVPFTPGGSTDIIARLVGQKLTELWGQQFVVDNRPGAGGALGAETVANAAPDGYTIMLTNPGPGLLAVLLRKKPSYRLADFAPIIYVGYTPNIIVANPKFPPNDLKSLIAYARANPGKVNWASPGTGSNPHVALEVLKASTGIDVIHVPYKGAVQAFTDLVAGQVDAQYTSYVSAENYVKAGRLKVLGTSGNRRQPAMPDVATFSEQGVKGADSTLWLGFVTTAKTPRAVIGKLNAGLNHALKLPDVKSRLELLGVEVEGGTPERFGAFVQSEAERITRSLKPGTIQIDP
jgi:tripartite-type tricarboxylate transporter receptor subunit TctC